MGIKQGVGATATRPFGAASTTRYHPCLHDAFHFSHLPLPRAVGPYAVIRTTKIIQSSLGLMMFGPKFDQDAGAWTNACADGYRDMTKSAGTANNMYGYVFDTIGTAAWGAAQITPAAFSVQIMNPESIQQTTGIMYVGRMRTDWKIKDNTATTGQQAADRFVSYNNPRLTSAAKLAFRGVQVDAVPFNMNLLSNFTSFKVDSDGNFGASANTASFGGLAPIFAYNPKGVDLQYLVCCEWRVRFDPSNPAMASHVQHQAPSESVWQKCLNEAEAIGNGCIDIADKVANVGNSLFGAMGSMYRAGRGARAIAGAGRLALM